MDALRDRIDELETQQDRIANASAAVAKAGVDRAQYGDAGRTNPPEVYSEHSPFSFFRDLASVSAGAWDPEARDRLTRYEAEQRTMNRTDGSGGQFVIPKWLTDDYVGLPRPGRVTADLLGRSRCRRTPTRSASRS